MTCLVTIDHTVSIILIMEQFTDEQKKQFEEHYSYSDAAEITAEEWEELKAVFDTPEKLRLLRKVLQVFTFEERGLTIPTPNEAIEKTDNLASYGLQVMVAQLADERIRKALLSFYIGLRNRKVDDLKTQFEKENAETLAEEKKQEKLEAEREQAKKQFGDNL